MGAYFKGWHVIDISANCKHFFVFIGEKILPCRNPCPENRRKPSQSPENQEQEQDKLKNKHNKDKMKFYKSRYCK